jgi:hypothetical protein
VAGCCECGDEPSCSGATELVCAIILRDHTSEDKLLIDQTFSERKLNYVAESSVSWLRDFPSFMEEFTKARQLLPILS